MTDHLTKEKRSWNMSRIKSKDTKPELIVRSLLHHLGYRFRLHSEKFPGKPDIVLTRYKTVIFVHGCFWHRHRNCPRASNPKSNQEYWKLKFKRNVQRFKEVSGQIQALDWSVLVVWECEIKNIDALAKKLCNALKIR